MLASGLFYVYENAGDIYTNSDNEFKTVLFWTQSGFAYLFVEIDERFLEDIYDIMSDRSKMNKKHFILMSKDEYTQNYFETKDDVCIEKRYMFEYAEDKIINEFNLPAGYELKEIDNELLMKISGTIVPSLFWKDVKDFLVKGKGYCISCGEDSCEKDDTIYD